MEEVPEEPPRLDPSIAAPDPRRRRVSSLVETWTVVLALACFGIYGWGCVAAPATETQEASKASRSRTSLSATDEPGGTMSRVEELAGQCTWNDDGTIATLDVDSPMFGKTVVVKFFTAIRSPAYFTINDTMKEALADFLALDASHMERLAELLFADCKNAFETVGYGVDVLEGETEAEANHREFGIHTPADALAQSTLKYVHIDGEKFSNRYFSIVFETPWGDLQHVVAKNGELFTVYEDGVYFGLFDGN